MKPVIKELLKELPINSTLDAIKAYFIAGGEGVELTSKQEELKECIEFADEQIRANNGRKNRDKIADLVAVKFLVSRVTAYKYMQWAEEVFSSSNPINKKYFIQLRIEWCQMMASKCFLEKDFVSAAMFEKAIAEYLKQYPDTKATSPKRTQVFIIPEAVMNNSTLEASFELVNSILKTTNGEEDTAAE